MIPNKTRERQLIPLTFQDRAVRTILIGGVLWFVAKDVCDILGLVNARDTIRNFPENERNTVAINDGIHDGPGNPNVNIVNEPGLYRLIFQSRKPEAEQFKTWVFNEVLPQIRQTGTYTPLLNDPNEYFLLMAIKRYVKLKRSKEQFTIELGKLLIRLKKTKTHGEFLPCLSEIGIPRSTAERCMKRYRKFTERELFIKDDDLKKSLHKINCPGICFNRTFIDRQLSLFHINNELPLNAI